MRTAVLLALASVLPSLLPHRPPSHFLLQILKARCPYKNYKDFVLRILECDRDETNKRFDLQTARTLAGELHAAGAARTLGFEPEPFIRILSTVSRAQFESINDVYPNKCLVKDITAKLGGELLRLSV